MPGHGTNVFVSYSHADAALVAPVVKLLRLNKSLVFQDIDSIRSGKKWRSEIATGVARSHLVVIFWCDHASRSDEVSKEWKAALELKKDLLPLLLDATPLPHELSDFQWIDFRATVGAPHSAMIASVSSTEAVAPAPIAAKKSTFLWSLALVAGAVVLGVASLMWFGLERGASPAPSIEGPPLSALSAIAMWLPWIILFLATAGVLLWWRWRSKRARPAMSPAAHPREFEHQVASEIEAEILRRTASRH